MTVHQTRYYAHSIWLKSLIFLGLPLVLVLLLTEQASAQICTPYPSPQARMGFNVARDGGRHIDNYDTGPLKAHWYLDYFTQVTPSQPDGMVYAQMIRPPLWKSSAFTTTVEATLAANPGALWLIGNEPDRDKQDGLTPAAYAVFYHDLYTFIKTRDPSAHLAVAGVVQSTPLRRRYLDMVLSEYQTRYGTAMPVDVWTMHAFILREDYTWGASIPPGLEAFVNEGMKYEVADHDNIEIFKNNIIAFRKWMADHGYRDKPLIVTEYGILLSPLHGFPYAKVRSFMLASFDFFLTKTDAATGYPADDNRLVQAWSWFSLNYPPYDDQTGFGHNGNLMEPDTRALLPLGQDYSAYSAALATQSSGIRLAFPSLQMTPPAIVISPTVPTATSSTSNLAAGLTQSIPTTITLTATLANEGQMAACNLTVHLYYQDAQGKQTRLATRTISTLGTTAANKSQVLSFTWEMGELAVGLHRLVLTAEADNANTGLPTAQLRYEYPFHVLAEPFSAFNYLPSISR